MKIALGADFAGFELKESIKKYLDNKNLRYKDFGTFKPDSGSFPEYAFKVGQALQGDDFDRGILIGDSGIGMCIAVNKMKGIRAATAFEITQAQYARMQLDVNVICLGSTFISETLALDITDIWLTTSFTGGKYEKDLDLMGKLSGM